MKVGDLVKTKDFEQYGIITEIVDIHALCLWYVVLWQCGNRSGQNPDALELVC